jgi:hypothetical protein
LTLKPIEIEPAIGSVKKAVAREPNLPHAWIGARETLLLLGSLLVRRRRPGSHHRGAPSSTIPNCGKPTGK